MKEVFLQHIWNMKLIDLENLRTYHGSPVEIVNFGHLNFAAGPDFFNSELVINKQLWVGCVEIHVNSSDWDLHQHSSNLAYHNVILHVVWNHDKEIDFLRSRNVETLILKDFVPKEVVFNYENLILNFKNTIVCKPFIDRLNWDKINFWLNGILIDRLQEKAENILNLSDKLHHNWEEVTFKLFAQNFGLKVNQDAFEIWANSFPFKVLQKIQHDEKAIESLFFGQAGFLNDLEDLYTEELKSNYNFLQHKFKLEALDKSLFKFSPMRPYGFPTIRLAQLSAIYKTEIKLFSKIIQFKDLKSIENFFTAIQLNTYWDTHFLFGKESKYVSKSISKDKIQNLIINTIIPLKFAYELSIDQLNLDFYLDLLSSLKPENNSTIDLFKLANFKVTSAKDSQTFLQLKKYYCDEKKCLNCALGHEVLKP